MKLPNGWEVAARAEMEGLFIYNEIFKDGCYMKHGIQMGDGDTVMDIGANVGQHSTDFPRTSQGCCLLCSNTIPMFVENPIFGMCSSCNVL